MTGMYNGTLGRFCFQEVERDLVAARQEDRSLGPQDLSRLASDYSRFIDSMLIFHVVSLPLTPFFSLSLTDC